MLSFVAYIPVGPDNLELNRTKDLIDSLVYYESAVSIILIDDGRRQRNLSKKIVVPRGSQLDIVHYPRKFGHSDSRGRLCQIGLLTLEYIKHRFGSEIGFVLKLDTDSLVINSFSDKIQKALARNGNAGIIGALGDSCNRSRRGFRNDRVVVHAIKEMVRVGRILKANLNENLESLRSWRILSSSDYMPMQSSPSETQRHALIHLSERLSPLLGSSFKGQHCQGGSYAVSCALLHQMSFNQVFLDAQSWAQLPFGEDRMMGIYCALLGLESVDFSGINEPFGTQARGLAYPPQGMKENGYSIIHSVKNDGRYPERSIRSFFRSARRHRR